MADIVIAPLADHPRFVGALTDMLHEEWGELANWSDSIALRSVIEGRLQTTAAPLALIALDGETRG